MRTKEDKHANSLVLWVKTQRRNVSWSRWQLLAKEILIISNMYASTAIYYDYSTIRQDYAALLQNLHEYELFHETPADEANWQNWNID